MERGIAQLKQRIADKYTAAQHRLTGLSARYARHDFVHARMDNVGAIHKLLTTLVEPE